MSEDSAMKIAEDVKEFFNVPNTQEDAYFTELPHKYRSKLVAHVIKLVFEKATDEATWFEMYARLCRKMMEQISPKVQDDGIRNDEGKLTADGQLFRKYLLNRCQGTLSVDGLRRRLLLRRRLWRTRL